jgi:hypothetical protein
MGSCQHEVTKSFIHREHRLDSWTDFDIVSGQRCASCGFVTEQTKTRRYEPRPRYAPAVIRKGK